ncbi:DUF1549 and DUF1553 domain-containing protein [Verrucomicrobiaceae bacterium 227]
MKFLLLFILTLPTFAGEISFKNDVMPIFMKGGCNAGGCHGAASGKDGFMLSLFGYDPEGDYYRLLEEFPGRRLNLAAPEKSLLLEKTAGTVAHSGGDIFLPGHKHYQTILKWISEGAQRDPEGAPEPVKIDLHPNTFLFEKPEGQVQAKVIATYSDGTTRDVTDLALYLTNNEGAVTINDDALVTPKAPGGTHIFARFSKFTASAPVTILPPGDFTWPEVEENNYIDTLVHEKLKALRILPSGVCSDEQFLRRATLDLTGLLPTTEEYHAFSANPDRAKLIDELLARTEFGELWAARWGEWLRIRTDTNPEKGTAMKAGWNYYHWLRDAMVGNLPWDQLAHQLVTGNGSNFRNPASNYYTMLPQGQLEPGKLSEDTAQIFLGVRTQCAMCHNHPFDRWTMDDYYSFSSFFTSVKRKHGSEAREYYTYADLNEGPAKHLLDDRPMPHEFLGGGPADVLRKDPRKVLSHWMTDPKNKLFRENLANRIWAQHFGRGIVHPVDDVRISNPPANAPLLEELGRRLAEDHQFDVRKLIREICLSRTYQLSARTNESNRNDSQYFSHAYLRRTRPDVLFDSISRAVSTHPTFRRSTAGRAVVLFEGGRNDTYNSYFFQTFGQAKRESVCTCETVMEANLSQALHLINGQTIDRALTHDSKLIPDLISAKKSPDEILSELYIRTLTRQPSPAEKEAILAKLPTAEKELRQFYNDVLWALLNSNEFLYNH